MQKISSSVDMHQFQLEAEKAGVWGGGRLYTSTIIENFSLLSAKRGKFI